MLSVQWGSATDVGRVRKANEDSLLAEPGVFVVADGMGGHAAGDLASAIAVDEFRALIGRTYLSVGDLSAAISRANAEIVAEASRAGHMLGMGTTLTGIALVTVDGSTQWAVFNVGDSRVYSLRHGELRQLTVDHSEVQELVASGHLTPEEALRHPRRNVVTRSLGSEPAPEPDIWLLPTVAGERFLACSDGLTKELNSDQIRGVLSAESAPQAAAEALVAQALQAGGRDNVTVVVVDFAGSFEGLFSINSDTAPNAATQTRAQMGDL